MAGNSFPADSLMEKRNHIIEMLKRSAEREELALSFLKKEAADIK